MRKKYGKRVLMVAFHFPPVRGSSGLQRTLRFANHLPEHGWDVRVLTVSPCAYQEVSLEQVGHISPNVAVQRVPCLDAAKHLSIRGRYLQLLALPDRWSTWLLTGVPAAIWNFATWRPDVLWTTYPIATAHLIGHCVTRITGLPWVADFRDSMTENHYPTDARVWRAYRSIELGAVQKAAACVFTAEGTRRMYAARYPARSAGDWNVIPNGYDEGAFTIAEKLSASRRESDGCMLLVHSGLLDPVDRNPIAFFDVLVRLREEGLISAGRHRVILRASGHDGIYRPELARRRLDDIVSLEPAIGYIEALTEMLRADGLLLFQGSSCNHQIPAKLYEYYRARRPVLCITDPDGDTAAAARAAGISHIFPWDDREQLATAMRAFFAGAISSSSLLASESATVANSRQHQTKMLAEILDRVRG